MCVQMQRIKGTGSDRSALSSWGGGGDVLDPAACGDPALCCHHPQALSCCSHHPWLDPAWQIAPGRWCGPCGGRALSALWWEEVGELPLTGSGSRLGPSGQAGSCQGMALPRCCSAPAAPFPASQGAMAEQDWLSRLLPSHGSASAASRVPSLEVDGEDGSCP